MIMFLLFLGASTSLIASGKKAKGPIPDNRALCPVCPSFTCAVPTGPTAPTGCTGGGCTGPCNPALTANFCCLTVTQSATIKGTVTANTSNISGNLSVGLNADIKGDLTVEGNADFKGEVCIEENLNVNGNMSVSGAGVILGVLTMLWGTANLFTNPLHPRCSHRPEF